MSQSKRITTVLGARPQFVKAAMVSRAMARCNQQQERFVETIVHTGQHYNTNMSSVFFEELGIPEPDYNLGINGGTHGQQTGQMLDAVEQVLLDIKPDVVLVYGDTNSTLAGSLAAVKLHIPIAHVEAGLRSFNKQMPEEVNRILTDHVSEYLFCPTDLAVDNLSNEGINKGVYQIGDVMKDCALYYRKKAEGIEEDLLHSLGVTKKSYYLATVHRAENTNDLNRLKEIFEGITAVSTKNCPTVIPLHPRTKKIIENNDLVLSEHIHLISPLSYLQMVAMECNAKLIMTDSGGIQKEAFIFGVPCLTLRDETEWVETVDAGGNVLVGADSQKIQSALQKGFNQDALSREQLYGNGDSAQLICEILGQ